MKVVTANVPAKGMGGLTDSTDTSDSKGVGNVDLSASTINLSNSIGKKSNGIPNIPVELVGNIGMDALSPIRMGHNPLLSRPPIV